MPYNDGPSGPIQGDDDDDDNEGDDGDEDGDDEDDDQDGDDDDQENDGKTSASATPSPDRGALHIKLPNADATVLFDGQKMLGMGAERWVLTPVIAKGETAKYQVQAMWNEDGKEVHQVREGTITAGEKATVDFTATDTRDVTSPTTAIKWQTLVMPAVSAIIGTAKSSE